MLYKINQNTEALEFVIDESFPKIGVELKKLGIKRDVLVAGIVRGEEFILPTGNAVLEKDDKIIIVTTSKKIKEISELTDINLQKSEKDMRSSWGIRLVLPLSFANALLILVFSFFGLS